MVAATTVLAIIILWSVLSRPLDQRGIISALFLTVGVLVFPGMAMTSVVLLSTMLASTDAALGQKVMSDPTVP